MVTECICGATSVMKLDRQAYRVTEEGETVKDESSNVSFGACIECGLIRQMEIPFVSKKDYEEYYNCKYEPNNPNYIKKNYRHDRDLANMRCEAYGIRMVGSVSSSHVQSVPQPQSTAYKYKLKEGKHRVGMKTFRVGDILERANPIADAFKDKFELISEPVFCSPYAPPAVQDKMERKKMLDIGAGSGAFVDKCRELGHDAYGCEIGKYNYEASSRYIYRKDFEGVKFPTDHFDIVTCHDVVEHVLNPLRFIDEMFRVTKQEGKCVVDFPNFFVEDGKHHWKAEHIWFFKMEELESMLLNSGFIIEKVTNPIPSKVVFYLSKPKQNRAKILLPPGIGDSYWSITKLEALIEREKLGIPDIYIACPRKKEFNGHKRAFPFIEMFPFLNATGETFESSDAASMKLWTEAYAKKGRTIFRNVFGYNYFISYNGHLRYGEKMEDLDPDLNTNWNPDMFVSLEQEYYLKESAFKYGKYIVFYFVFQGTYKYWTNEFSVSEVINSVNKIAEKTGCVPVFAGAVWDQKKDPLLAQVKSGVPQCIDLTGQTSVEQLFGLIRGSEMVIGYPSGLTISSALIGAKTLIIWNSYYNSDFFWNACPPLTRDKTYFIENTKHLTAEKLTKKAVSIINLK